jgi:TonB family protein
MRKSPLLGAGVVRATASRGGLLAPLVFAWLGMGTTVAVAQPGLVPPKATCSSGPKYPDSERASGRAGRVVLHVHLDEQGQVQQTAVVQGMGEPFDEAARRAVGTCTFSAGTQEGTPIATLIELSVDFVAPPLPARLEGEVVGAGGEPLAGATLRALGSSAQTDEQGRFTLDVEPTTAGEIEVLVEKSGHATRLFTERLGPGERRRVRFSLPRENPFETRVIARRLLPELPEVDRTPQVSRFRVSAADIDRTPGALEDISRVVQGLPGVVADPDLLATLFVRGGGPNEVVFYLDGVPLANPFHLGGFATLYNPMMIGSADFYAGSAPGRYEPALSGVLDVRYAKGETSRPKVWADLSMHSAKARVDTPTGIEGLSVTLAARRSFFELYFAGLRALNIVGRNYVAPDISEYLARAHYRRGRHELTASLLHASDGFSFLVEPGEQLLVNFAGGLQLSNVVQMAILEERTDLGGENELSFTFALTRDVNHTSLSGETVFAQDAQRLELFSGAAIQLVPSERHRSRAGLQFTRRDLRFEGQVADSRALAPWSSYPFVATDSGFLDIHPRLLRNTLAGYIEHQYRPFERTMLEGSARVQVDLPSGEPTYSFHAAASRELPTATVLKASGGMAAQRQANPLLWDGIYGNPALAPERSLHLVVGVEQPLPFHALLRLEGYGKWLSALSVNPDSRAGLEALLEAGEPVFQSTGTGFARGAEMLFLGRTERVAYGVAAGLLSSTRHNPLASGPKGYRAPWDQRLTASAHASYAPDENWILSGRASFHTGRPFTPVEEFVLDQARALYVPRFGATNSVTYPDFFEGSVRVERRFELGPLRAAWYAEVINVTNAQNVFTYVYDGGVPAEGVLPQRAEFNHLPIRPFLGLRAQY